MSLLLDALKKAEEEKNKQSSEIHLESDSADSVSPQSEEQDGELVASELHEEPINATTLETDVIPEEKPEPEENLDVSSLSGEFEDDAEVASSEEFEEVSRIEPAYEIEVDTLLDDINFPENDQKQETPAFNSAIVELEKDKGEVFDTTLSEGTIDELLQDIQGDQLYQPTSAIAAQAVLMATQGRKRSQIVIRLSLGVLAILLLVFSIVFYYFFSSSIMELSSVDPVVFKGVADVTNTKASVAYQDLDGTGVLEVTSDTKVVQDPPIVPEALADTSIVILSDHYTESEVEVVESEQEHQDLTGGETERGHQDFAEEEINLGHQDFTEEETNLGHQDFTEKETKFRVPPEYTIVNPTLISITKNKLSPHNDTRLAEAFAAYNAGRYATASTIYQAVLDSGTNDRQALLGLAAIAVHQAKLQHAYGYYLEVLEIDPEDKIAKVAVINMFSNDDLLARESQLKLLLSSGEESSYAYFTLGKVYAKQSRWSDASSAFLNAYKLDLENPNYALNLAISLDHINNHSAALVHYRIALANIRGKESQFDMSAIRARIQALSAKLSSS